MSADHAAITGRALPLRGDDIDTDRIIPARFLKSVTFEGLETAPVRRRSAQLQAARQRIRSTIRGTQARAILLVNANFGCGSSREHAPQAIRRHGIRASSASRSPRSSSATRSRSGMPCVTASPRRMQALMAAVEARPATEV